MPAPHEAVVPAAQGYPHVDIRQSPSPETIKHFQDQIESVRSSFPESAVLKPLAVIPDLHGNIALMAYHLIANGVIDNQKIEPEKIVLYVENEKGVFLERESSLPTESQQSIDWSSSDDDVENEPSVEARDQLPSLRQSIYQTEIRDVSTQYDKLYALYKQHGQLLKLVIDSRLDPQNFENYRDALKNNIAAFKALINEIRFADKALAIRFLGDMLADRGVNDYFTLLLLKRMHDEKIDFDINLSNHDAEFIDAFFSHTMNNRYKSTMGEGQTQSLSHLCVLIRDGYIDYDEIKGIVRNNYLPHLKLIGYATDDQQHEIIDTHAPIDLRVIEDLAKTLGMPYKPLSCAEDLHHLIDAINTRIGIMAQNGELASWLKEESNRSLNTIQSLPAEDMMRKKLSENAGYLKKTFLQPFIWSRINTVVDKDEETEKNGIRGYYTALPTNPSDWKSNILHRYGHTGPDGGIKTKTRENDPHYTPQDESSLGKGSVLEGALIQTICQKNRATEKILRGALTANDLDSIYPGADITQCTLDLSDVRGLSQNTIFQNIKMTSLQFMQLLRVTKFDQLARSTFDITGAFSGDHINFIIQSMRSVTQKPVKLSQSFFDLLFGWGIKKFSGMDLTRLDLSNKDLHECIFEKANLTGAKIINSDIRDASFKESNLSDAEINDITINMNTSFTKAKFKGGKSSSESTPAAAVEVKAEIDSDWDMMPDAPRITHALSLDMVIRLEKPCDTDKKEKESLVTLTLQELLSVTIEAPKKGPEFIRPNPKAYLISLNEKSSPGEQLATLLHDARSLNPFRKSNAQALLNHANPIQVSQSVTPKP